MAIEKIAHCDIISRSKCYDQEKKESVNSFVYDA